MSAFRFNFVPDDQEPEGTSENKTDAALGISESRAWEVASELREGSEIDVDEVRLTPAFSLVKGVVSTQTSVALLRSQELAVSDLVPGKYEGGFKLWECALDLARVLSQRWNPQQEDIKQAVLRGQRVLELGCGHGLPGILAALLGSEVHFQDYNEEVLQRLTMPNLAANLERRRDERSGDARFRFFAGDWAGVPSLLRQEGLSATYDMIFSTDTIYSTASQKHLLACISEALKPGGVAYIGAKNYYFGVGGSIAEFKQLALESGRFEVTSGQAVQDGASNVREVFLLARK